MKLTQQGAGIDVRVGLTSGTATVTVTKDGVSIAAAENLEAVVAWAYSETSAAAYAHVGISSMNGDTDEADETVSVAAFRKILGFAATEHLARLTFWAVNRDRPCGAGLTTAAGSCSGIAQPPYAFTELLRGYAP